MAKSHPLMFEDGGNGLSQRSGADLPSLAETERKQLVFTQQWMQHQSVLRAYLASFLGGSTAVDDALQEVAVVVWQKGPWDGDSSAFLAYSLACARRIALATCRKLGDTRLELLSPETANMLADQVVFQEQQDAAAPDELMHALRKCLEKVNPENRELLESRYSGESREELAQLSKRVGKSMDALYKTLERLRERLRNCVERSHRTIR